MKYFLLFAFCLLSAQAATWYVRTDGNNSNTGSANTSGGAKLTLDAALSIATLAAGDTIEVGVGTFTDTANTDVAGSSGSRITINGAGQGVTYLNGPITVDQPYYTLKNFSCTEKYTKNITLAEAADYTIIEYITTVRPWYFVDFQGADNCIVRNCDISRWMENAAINLSGSNNEISANSFHNGTEGTDVIRANGQNDCVITGNTFYDLFTPNNNSGTSTDTLALTNGTKSLTTQGAMGWVVDDYIKIQLSTDSGTWMKGWITAYDSGTGAMTVDIVTTRNGGPSYSSWIVKLNAAGNHSDIIQAFGNDNANTTDQGSYNLVFEKNLIYDSDAQWGNVSTDGETNIIDWTFRNNIFRNARLQFNLIGNTTPYSPPPTGFKFHNNTFFNDMGTTGLAGPPAEIYNNIFCRIGNIESAGPYGGGVVLADYNLMTDYDDSAKTAYPKNVGQEANGINGGYTPTQIFVDPVNGDFHLAVGSPAIDAGMTIASVTNDFAGTARTGTYDMGAYAYVTDTTPPDPPVAPSGSVDGGTITLVFEESVTFGAGGNAGWTLSMSGGASTMTYSAGSGTATLVYTLSRAIGAGETGTLAYTQPGNGVEDLSGNDLATVSGIAVTNNTAVPDTTPPAPSPLTVADVTNVTITTITITSSEATDVGTPPVEYDISVNGVWQDLWQSSRVFALTGLSPLSEYAIKVKARDSAGTPNVGAESSVLLQTTLAVTPTPRPTYKHPRAKASGQRR